MINVHCSVYPIPTTTNDVILLITQASYIVCKYDHTCGYIRTYVHTHMHVHTFMLVIRGDIDTCVGTYTYIIQL